MAEDGTAQPERFLLYASERYALSVLRPLQTAIRATGGESAWFFDGPGAEFLRADERLLTEIGQVKAYDAQVVFVPGNWVPDFFPGAKVEVFHGFSVGKRSDRRGHFRIRGWFDLYCTHGPTTTARFQELARKHGSFHVEETGWPKIDPLFRELGGPNPWREDWEHQGPILLYGSTFTSGLSSATVLCRRIGELATSGPWNWLVTLHPKMDPETVRAYRRLEGSRLRFADTDDIVPLLGAADAMVSDTSSIVHEFLMLHKPVVTLRNSRPGPELIDIDSPQQLESSIRRALSRPSTLMREIEDFTRRIHPYRDGRSSERVLDATRNFLTTHQARLKRKPLNLVRRIKLRSRLGYYRWS